MVIPFIPADRARNLANEANELPREEVAKLIELAALDGEYYAYFRAHQLTPRVIGALKRNGFLVVPLADGTTRVGWE